MFENVYEILREKHVSPAICYSILDIDGRIKRRYRAAERNILRVEEYSGSRAAEQFQR